jgi:hypothetical protein
MDKLLLEYPWLPKVVSLSKDHGLDWLMMACLALELSGGDPRCRTLDGEFLLSELGPTNPHFAMHWHNSVPEIKLVDLATRWGLFQILGRIAVDNQVFTGRIINFTDIGANVRAACLLAQKVITNGGTIDDVALYFGADPDRIRALMDESRASVELLLTITEAVAETEEEEVEQA